MSTAVWDAFFEPVPGYLDTASIGLPPTTTVDAVATVIDGWRRGRYRPQDFDEYVVRARAAWARLVGLPVGTIAIGSTVSALVGTVAGSLADGSRVLVPAGDFTSVLFPFLVQQERGRVSVTEVELADLVASVDDGTDLVAVSSVQSSDGRRVDVPALLDAAGRHGARVLLDVTQSCSWLPLDCSRVDYVVCAGYKWLLCPRGVAFLAVRADLLDAITPVSAGWYAGADVWSSVYGSPLRLAPDARRLDTSPAWFSWVGAAHSLELLASLDTEAVHAYTVALADRFLAGLGLPPAGSAIAAVSQDGADELLEAAGVRASLRAGRARLSFHLYNQEADVDRAVDALSGALPRSGAQRHAEARVQPLWADPGL
jgi:selenocysteine lyase/cysteine desulfurase